MPSRVQVRVPRTGGAGGTGGRTPAAPRSAGGGSRGAASGAGAGAIYGLAEALTMVGDVIVKSYMRDEYEEMWRESNERQWKQGLERHRARMQAVIDANAQRIQWWQEEGREVTLLVALQVEWMDSGFGLEGLTVKEMSDAQLAAEGLPEPALKLAERGFAAAVLDAKLGLRMQAVRVELVLEGTRPDVRRLREIAERLSEPGVDETERAKLREEGSRLEGALPEGMLAPQSYRELAPSRRQVPPAPAASERAAAIAAKRAEVRSLERSRTAALHAEARAGVDERLRAARVELRLLELEDRLGRPFEKERREEVARMLEDIVFYEWKAERERLPANERAALENLRHKLDEVTSP